MSYKEKTAISSPHRPLNSSTHNPLSHNPLTHNSSSHSPINPSSHQPVTLVTGGAGFIGSHLCERLLSDGYQVICLDNFNDFYDPKIKEQNISEIKDHPNFTLIHGDILDTDLLEEIFSGTYKRNKRNKRFNATQRNKPYEPYKPNKPHEPNKRNERNKTHERNKRIKRYKRNERNLTQ